MIRKLKATEKDLQFLIEGLELIIKDNSENSNDSSKLASSKADKQGYASELKHYLEFGK